MTEVAELVSRMEAVGIQLWEDGGQIRFRAPVGALTEESRDALRAHKAALVEYLRGDVSADRLVPDPASLHQPFPLTDVQSAYLLGRSTALDYGGVGCQVYLEAAFRELDPARLEAAWRVLVDRHPMLRAVIDDRGFQRVLPTVPAYRVAVTDRDVRAVRDEMCRRSYEPDRWPLFDVRVSVAPDGALLHLSFDLLIADFMSIQLLLDELHQLYFTPDRPLPALPVTFRDYALAERRVKERRTYRRAHDYWWRRLDDLPAAPALPMLDQPETRGHAEFRRWQTELGPAEWARLRELTGARQLTPSGTVLGAYAETLGRWTRQDRYTLGVTLLNRLPLHPSVDGLVGDFTSVDLLAVDQDPGRTFAERARRLQAQLWEDMDHISCSGVEVLRELGRRRGRAAALMPIVFTSAIALNDQGQEPRFWRDARLVDGLTQTPQVWIDCQVLVRNGGLAVNWDVRDGVFPPGLIDEMFAAFEHLLHRLATDGSAWDEPVAIPLPAAQAARRHAVNATTDPAVPAQRLLHDAVVERALAEPDRPAVAGSWGELTYGDLLARAAAVAAELAGRTDAPVAVVMEKGPDQVVGVLGTLLAGAAYLPVDVTQPPVRRDRMLADAGVRFVLTASEDREAWPAGVTPIAVDTLTPRPAVRPLPQATPDDIAYVIYTSGSTGTPKGVQITHRSALNTIEDINRRFAVTAGDRVLGLANLGFDLSVYDVFGPLALGGCLVLPDHDRRSDPSHWAELVAAHGVTLWNSVPAQMQMLTDYLATAPEADVTSLRLAMLSGDWIPVNLPDRIRAHAPDLELISLGGATEGSIWSIWYPIREVSPAWRSIPYGRPLANQTFHVLDPWYRDCPDGVTGELFIGGVGVAAGYLGDAGRTAERFVRHPRTGERLYRTGDLGRYLPTGDIEFLGREDAQVKIRGHRIELAEVEAAIVAHPDVANAAVLVDGETTFDRRLVAFVETAPRPAPDRQARDDLAIGLAEVAEKAGSAVMESVDREGYVGYLRRLDDVALYSMLDAFRSRGLFSRPDGTHSLDDILTRMQVVPRHHRVVRRWLRALHGHGLVSRDAATGRYASDSPADATTIAAAWHEVDDMLARFDPASATVHDYFKASTGSLPELLRSDGADAVQLLFPEGRLDVTESLYNITLFNRWANQIVTACTRYLAATKTRPGPLRILEVGAGVGGTSKDVIPALADHDVEYHFTDLSQFFLNKARATFQEYPWVRYATLDIDTDFRAQGFSPNAFDVVILGDVMHATRHVGRTVAALRELLAPDGWLLFAEMTRDHYQIMTSMELILIDDAAGGDFEDLRHGKDQTFVGHRDWLRLLARPGDELTLALPHDDDVLGEIGLRVYASRVKRDRTRLDPQQIVDAVAARLPSAMVPSLVQIVDGLPLTANAKVDRERLGALVPRSRDARVASADQPADDFERRIAALWAEVLNVPQVGRTQGFFDLGGDSLLASQLTGQLIERLPEAKTMEFTVLLRLMLEGPTVMTLAAQLREAP